MPENQVLQHEIATRAKTCKETANDEQQQHERRSGYQARWNRSDRVGATFAAPHPAGSTLHAVADEGVPIRAIAEVIGRHLDLPVAAISPEDAAEHFTWLAGFLSLDAPASSTLTRELLGWQPTNPGLIDDLDQGHYFHGMTSRAMPAATSER